MASESPNIDFDTNLLSSPSWNIDGCCDGGGRDHEIGIRVDGNNVSAAHAQNHYRNEVAPSTATREETMGGAAYSNQANAANGHASRKLTTSTAITTTMTTEAGTANDDDGGLKEEDLDKMTELVESWREELYMMNVKNSILLDDLVKVGADV